MAKCCSGAECYRFQDTALEAYKESEPCWGDIEAIDEYWDPETNDSYWIHSCQGHWDQYCNCGPYIKEPVRKDNG